MKLGSFQLDALKLDSFKPEKLFKERGRWFSILAYNTLFWVAFWAFCYFSFPYDRLAHHLSDRVAKAGKGYTLEIGSLEPYWLSGVELTDVVLRKTEEATPARLPGDEKPPAPRGFRVPEARARLSLLPLLFGTKKVQFDMALDDGEIEGSYAADDESQEISVHFDEVDLQKLGLFESMLGVPAFGKLDGDIDLTLHRDAKQTQGEIKLAFEKLVIGDGKAKVKIGGMGGLTLDPVEAGNLDLEIDVKDGLGKVKRLSSNGKDLVLRGSGDVRFAQPLMATRLSILLNVKVTDAYRNKSPRTQAMFSLLDNSSAPQIRAAKLPDGALQYRLTGALTALRPVPEGAGRGSAPRVPRPSMPAPGPEDDDEGE